MGTRADFYVGRGENAEWLGSIAWDGYPSGIDTKILKARTETTYRKRLAEWFATRDDVTLPARGWPWPWENSQTTDYAYAFDAKAVHASCFGHAWFDPNKEEPEHDSAKPTVFPTFSTERFKRPGQQGSGVILITG